MRGNDRPLRLYDISLPLQPSLAEWPGDAPFQLDFTSRLSEGSSVNLCSVSMSVHTGTHADAPFHFLGNGATVDKVGLEVYCGPCAVVDVRNRSVITRQDIAHVDWAAAPRLLLKTGAWTDHSRFPDTVPVMEPDVPAYLQEKGVVLVGVDVPSVDAIDSRDLPIHHALGRANIHILESLYLEEMPEGVYELIALPLRIAGADGSPVRAVLRELRQD